MAITIQQAIETLGRFEREKDAAILKGIDDGMVAPNGPLRLAVTKYMQGLGSGKSARQPNPPPGPIGIRSGRLRRALSVVKAFRTAGGYGAGLRGDLAAAPYLRIQEFGGVTRAHDIVPRNKLALRWTGIGPGRAGRRRGRGGALGGGYDIFARRVHHPGSRIPARPFMRPAAVEGLAAVRAGVEASLDALTRRLFGG